MQAESWTFLGTVFRDFPFPTHPNFCSSAAWQSLEELNLTVQENHLESSQKVLMTGSCPSANESNLLGLAPGHKEYLEKLPGDSNVQPS